MQINLFVYDIFSFLSHRLAEPPLKLTASEQNPCVKAATRDGGSFVYSHECEITPRAKRSENHMVGYSFNSYTPSNEQMGNSIEDNFQDQYLEMEYDPIDEGHPHSSTLYDSNGEDPEASHAPFIYPSPIQNHEHPQEAMPFMDGYSTRSYYEPIDNKDSNQVIQGVAYDASFYPVEEEPTTTPNETPKFIEITDAINEANGEPIFLTNAGQASTPIQPSKPFHGIQVDATNLEFNPTSKLPSEDTHQPFYTYLYDKVRTITIWK
ncbi:hypothetical protein DSO57_1039467 [Entomophthora muscae]|uniref:Uncharacterized protein n=1 Tax=Entomophthora muscae TaxID=34485 RepID=A0ACC2U812_9FUNG|nr:hypothetical protein DSO57_1039467 [Entomophthora muscae]